jgi:transposase
MSCITKQHVGKYTYLYESTSYRDEKGRPRNHKKRIGKIDPYTGETIYTEEYLARMEDAGRPVKQEPRELSDADRKAMQSASEVLDASRRYGSYALFRDLADRIHLLDVLRKAFPASFREIFSLACFLVESQEPLAYFAEWMSQTETLPLTVPLSSQRISDLLASITLDQRDAFFSEWVDHTAEDQYVALDITSISSYSQLMESCEWGYNRDHEDLPQINLCMLFGESARLPVYQTSYHGSLKDVSTLRTTLDEVRALVPSHALRVVMDKGFYSQKNVDAMLDPEHPVHFLISVPFTSSFAKRQVESERKDIDRLENTILTSDGAIRGVHKVRAWHTKERNVPLHVHVYFNPVKAATERNELYGYVMELKLAALADPERSDLQKEFQKYLIIRKSSKQESGYTVNVRQDVIDKKLNTCGWMVLLSDVTDDAQEALDVYRTKDVVEKNFLRLKNTLDLNRLRVHSDVRMENKLFLSFIAMLLVSALHQRMKQAGLYQKYTMHELLLKVRKLHAVRIKNRRILQPVTKEQRQIFQDLGMDVPVG